MAEARNVQVRLTADVGPYRRALEAPILSCFWGFPVVVSGVLPIEPSFGEQVARRVRHALKAWCPEALRTMDAGMTPEASLHCFRMSDPSTPEVIAQLLVSQELYDTMLDVARKCS